MYFFNFIHRYINPTCRSFILVALLCLGAGRLAAQSQKQMEDSMKHLIATAPTDTAKINLMNQVLGWKSRFASLQEVDKLAEEIVRYGQKAKHPKGMVTAYRAQSNCHSSHGDAAGTFNAANAGLAVAEKEKDPYLIAVCQMGIGISYAIKLDNISALKYFNLASVNAEFSGNKEMISSVYSCLANIYKTQKLYEESLKYSKKMAEIIDTSKHHSVAMLYFNLARAFSSIAKNPGTDGKKKDSLFENAFQNATLSLQLAKQLDWLQLSSSCYNVISEYYFLNKKNLNKAKEYAQLGLKDAEAGQIRGSVIESSILLSDIYFAQHEFDSALIFGKTGYDLAERENVEEWIIDAKKTLSKIYNQLGDYKLAYSLLEQSTAKNDSLEAKQRINQLGFIQGQFNEERNQLEIKNLKQKGELQIAIRNVSIAGIVIILVFSLILFDRYRKSRLIAQKLNVQQAHIQKQNELLEKSLDEKETLLKEIHHRVKNNLQLVSSLLSLQRRATDNESVADSIMESQSRVKSIALIHEKLYITESIEKIDLKEYITELLSYLNNSYSHSKLISFNLQAERILADVDTAMRLGLVVNELVCNAMKYAFPDNKSGAIAISLDTESSNIILRVSDNGVGMELLPTDESNEKSSSLGYKLIRSVVRQLHATMQIDVKNGTSVQLTIPSAPII